MLNRDDRRLRASVAVAARSLPALLVLAAVFIAHKSQPVSTEGRPMEARR